MRRLLTTSALAASLLSAMAMTALAGGSLWEFEGYYRPGEVVVSTAAVAWDHDGELGRPEEGPYLLYMAPIDVSIDDWPEIPEQSMLVGIVEVRLGPFEAEDGSTYGSNQAVARFEIPDVTAGSYQILHCNDPCSTTLGDVVGGWDLRVIGGSGGRPAEEIDADVRARIPIAPLLIPAETSTPTTASDNRLVASAAEAAEEPDPVPDTTRQPAPSQDPDSVEGQPGRFDNLWLVIVGVVGLLLVVQMIRIEWRGRQQSFGPEPRNESGSSDVSTDE